MKTLNDLLDEAARLSPEKPFLVTADQSSTFSQARGRILGLAAGLAAKGIRKGDCVAIVHRNSPRFVEAYFALARLGAVAVPLNFLVQKPEELAFMLNDCRAVAVITQREFLKGLKAAAAQAPSVQNVWLTDAASGEESLSALSDGQGGQPPAAGVTESDVASVLYSSWTTGTPKGVMLTHRNLLTNCEASAARLGLRTSDVGLCILPMFHSFAWTGNVLVALKMRCKLVISPSIAPPRPWLQLMSKHGVTLFAAVPQVYSVLAKEACGFQRLVLKWWFFRKVRLAISGAAPLAPAVAEAFEKALGVPILEGYGLTETSPVATINTLKERRPRSVGRTIEGAAVKVVSEDETSLPVGSEGEICIKGDNVMKGYLGLPEATREAFTKDGWFKTGDVGALDEEGYLYIRDRKKDMIIIKGLKVFSAQVEATLIEHPAVAECAVIGVPDEHGDETIKAFFVLKPGATVEKSELMKFCRAKLDPYKRPRDIEIVDALPKNALQKVLKRDLRARELAKAKRPAAA